MDKAEPVVVFRMLAIETSAARAELADRATAQRSALLAWVEARWAADSAGIVSR
jgi:hypothetical protein